MVSKVEYLSTFSDFRHLIHSADQVHFQEFNLKKSAILAACADCAPPQHEHFILYLQIHTFLLLQRTVVKKKTGNTFLNSFAQRKKICLVYLDFQLLKKLKLTFPHCAGFKKVFLFGVDFRVTVNFLRPCGKLKSNIEKLYFGIGVLKQFGTTWQVSNFFSKLHPP